jgi:hypothetical protein
MTFRKPLWVPSSMVKNQSINVWRTGMPCYTELWRKPADELTEGSGVVKKGSVVDHQLGLGVDLFLLNCWIAGCQVLLSRRPFSRLM